MSIVTNNNKSVLINIQVFIKKKKKSNFEFKNVLYVFPNQLDLIREKKKELTDPGLVDIFKLVQTLQHCIYALRFHEASRRRKSRELCAHGRVVPSRFLLVLVSSNADLHKRRVRGVFHPAITP